MLALIIGASRGLGLALAEEYLKRGWDVVATARGQGTGLHALAERAKGLTIEMLDINEPDQIAGLRDRLATRRFDLLFVNAGVTNDPAEKVGQVSTENFVRVMTTNVLGPMRAVEVLEGLVTPEGTIGVMSSGLGSISDNEAGGWEVYRASKAALNMLMKSFSRRTANDPRSYIIIAPGWVRTDMGGPRALLSIDESIPRVVDVITSQAGKPGIRYMNYLGKELRW